jgi:predicted glycosyltransferase
MFFKYFVERLKKDNHDILCTGRDYREAKELALLKKINIKSIGKHGGDNKFEKLNASTERAYLLSEIINSFNPNLTVSFSSPEAARVSFGLGIKHFIFNDSPHATAVAKLTIPLVDRLFCPWVIPFKEWTKFGLEKDKITRYRALDPIVWVKKELENINNQEVIKIKKSLNIEEGKKVILIRPEEIKASYIADKKLKNSIEVIEKIVNNFSDKYNILILARYKDQIDFYKERFEKKIGTKVIEKVTDGMLLLRIADLFIGAGGTMSAEAALIGKPVISITPINFHVENYLIKTGLIKKISNSNTINKYIKSILSTEAQSINEKKSTFTNSISQQDKINKISQTITSNMEDPIEVFKKFLLDP